MYLIDQKFIEKIDQTFIEKKIWQYFHIKWPPSNKKSKF